MFEEITGEDNIKRTVGHRPRLGAVLRQNLNSGCSSLDCVRIEVHTKAVLRSDVVNELAVSTTQIQYTSACRKPSCEVLVDEHSPDIVAVLTHAGKTRLVQSLQLLWQMGTVHATSLFL